MIDFFIDWFMWGWLYLYPSDWSKITENQGTLICVHFVIFIYLTVILIVNANVSKDEKLIDLGQYNFTLTTLLILCCGFWWFIAPIVLVGHILFNIGKELKVL